VTGSDHAAGSGARPSTRGKTARQYAEPLRELAGFTALTGNAVILTLAIFDLIFVIDQWASGFDDRSSRLFPDFVGLTSVGLPLAAVLLGFVVQPRAPRAAWLVTGALVEYAVAAFFGLVTFFGAFANEANGAYFGDQSAIRNAVEDSLRRLVWFSFLALAGVVLYRIWRGEFYTPRPRPTTFPGYPTGYGRQPHPARSGQQYGPPGYSRGGHPQPSYGQPYPGYPATPGGTTAAPPAQPGLYGSPAQPGLYGSPAPPGPGTGDWPTVPPPPMPHPPGPFPPGANPPNPDQSGPNQQDPVAGTGPT
jgi:hypothetical protein